MKLKAISLKGVGPYSERATFKVKPGLSVIYGLNHTSGKQSKNSNWVGKSLFFSTVSELLYEEPIVGSKQDRIQEGSQGIVLEAEGVNYKITRTDGKYKIVKDGEPVEFPTKTKAQEFIRTLWPLTKEEYETFVHIDSRVPHPLVMGSTAVRKEFFTKFFGLDRVDAERKLYNAALTELSKTQRARDTLRSTYEMITADIPTEARLAEMEAELSDLSAQIDSSKAELLKAQERNQLLDFIEINSQSVKLLEDKGLLTVADFERYVESLEQKVQEQKRRVKDAKAYYEYKVANQAYLTAYEALPEKIKTLSLEKATEGSQRYLRFKREADSYQADLERLTAKAERLKCEKPEPIEDNLTREDYLLQVATIKKAISDAEKFKTGVCPTCGQPVKTQNTKELKAQLADLDRRMSAVSEYNAQTEQYLQYEQARAEISGINTDLDEALEKVNRYRKYHKACQLLEALPQKPDPYEGDEMDLDTEQEALRVEQTAYDQVEHIRRLMPKFETYFALADKSRSDFDFDAYNRLCSRQSTLDAQIRSSKATLEKANTIKAQLDELDEKLKDVEPLEVLIDLYQDKNLKKQIVSIIGTRLMALVNRYAAQIFPEDYQFTLEWDTQINIVCRRKAGDTELLTDVRKLSGAESKLFTMILVLSLLSFVPSAKRPNIMILDEPESNLSPETTAMFMRLLEHLTQLVESVIVITVRHEAYPGAHCYTIIREGSSKIVEGHPDDL